MENPVKMDDLGVPLFSETSIWRSKKDTGKLKKYLIPWDRTSAHPCHRKGSHETSLVQQRIQDTLHQKKTLNLKNMGNIFFPRPKRYCWWPISRVYQLILVICTGFLLVGVVARWPGTAAWSIIPAAQSRLQTPVLRRCTRKAPGMRPKHQPVLVTTQESQTFDPTSNSLTMSGQGWLLGRSKCHRLRPSYPKPERYNSLMWLPRKFKCCPSWTAAPFNSLAIPSHPSIHSSPPRHTSCPNTPPRSLWRYSCRPEVARLFERNPNSIPKQVGLVCLLVLHQFSKKKHLSPSIAKKNCFVFSVVPSHEKIVSLTQQSLGQ